MATSTYADLEIRVLRKEGDRGYPVELNAEGREFLGGYLCPDVLEKWKPDPKDPAASGQALFDLLLADQRVRDGWQRIWGWHEHRRVRLRVDQTAPELDALPWEALHYGGLYLAADASTPVSRYLADEKPADEPVADRPLKLLVAIASPDLIRYPELARIDVTLEKETLQQALAEVAPAELKVDFLEDTVTLLAIGEKLGDGYHVLHVIAHGRFDSQENAALCLADAGNQARWVKTSDFVTMLNGVPQKPRLVFLASCQSATRSPTDALRGLAPALVCETGVSAVLALLPSPPSSAGGRGSRPSAVGGVRGAFLPAFPPSSAFCSAKPTSCAIGNALIVQPSFASRCTSRRGAAGWTIWPPPPRRGWRRWAVPTWRCTGGRGASRTPRGAR